MSRAAHPLTFPWGKIFSLRYHCFTKLPSTKTADEKIMTRKDTVFYTPVNAFLFCLQSELSNEGLTLTVEHAIRKGTVGWSDGQY